MRPPSHRTLSVRLPAAEAAEVEAFAAAGGEFVSHLIRRAVLREVRRSATRPSG
jgi:hypothetical protein